MFKAIAIDLDMTVLRSDCSISLNTAEVFKRAKRLGIEIIVCTGRSVREVRYSAAGALAGRYMVVLTGVQAYDNEMRRPLYKLCIPKAGAAEAAKRFSLESELFFQIYQGEWLYTSSQNRPMLERCSLAPDDLAMTLEALKIDAQLCENLQTGQLAAEKFFAISPSAAVIERARRAVDDIPGLSLAASYGHSLEIMPFGADKGVGLVYVLEKLNLRAEDVIAFGDSENDLPMFEKAGFCVAVDNACAAVKARADAITASNDDDGVAIAVERLVFGD